MERSRPIELNLYETAIQVSQLFESCGYNNFVNYRTKESMDLQFVKYLFQSDYPRYHASVSLSRSIDARIHLDKRPHHSSLYSLDQSNDETRRVIAKIEQFPDSAGKTALIKGLRNGLLFGLPQSISSYLELTGRRIDHKVFSGRRRNKPKGAVKSAFENKKRRALEQRFLADY